MITSVIVAKRIKKNLKNGRKIFKFLKSIDEIKAIYKLLKNNSDFGFLTLLKVLQKVFGALYYVLDNVVWLSGLGMFKR